MALEYQFSLPVSGFQIGVSAASVGLSAKAEAIGDVIADLGATLAAQAEYSLSLPPNVTAIGAAVSAGVNLAALAGALTPTAFIAGSADARVEDLALLGLIEARLAVAAELVADLELGVSAGGIAAWQYRGPAAGMGAALAPALAASGGVPLGADVSGAIVVTESGAAWAALRGGIGALSDAPGVSPLGARSGGEWCTALREPLAEIRAYLLELEGLRAAVSARLQLSAGVGLPSPEVMLELGVGIDLDGAIESLGSVSLDVEAQISGVLARIDALLALAATLDGFLTGDMLSLWRYSGALSALPGEVSGALSGGIPGGAGGASPVSAIVLVCRSPTAWAGFGKVLAVG